MLRISCHCRWSQKEKTTLFWPNSGPTCTWVKTHLTQSDKSGHNEDTTQCNYFHQRPQMSLLRSARAAFWQLERAMWRKAVQNQERRGLRREKCGRPRTGVFHTRVGNTQWQWLLFFCGVNTWSFRYSTTDACRWCTMYNVYNFSQTKLASVLRLSHLIWKI